jgi:type I restriction enzyme R subunit
MWLTGFDASCMQTIYMDKPMQGHGLIQAIARVNRVFRDKPAGLVVDYIGVAQNLKNALGHYSKPDQEQTGIDEVQAVAVMLEKYEIVLAMFQPHMSGGFELVLLLRPTPRPSNAFGIMAGAIDWIMTMRQEASASPFR